MRRKEGDHLLIRDERQADLLSVDSMYSQSLLPISNSVSLLAQHISITFTRSSSFVVDVYKRQQQFYNDEYPLPHEPLLAVLQTLVHGAVQWEDLGLFAWCSSHPFLCVGHNHHAPWHAIIGSMYRSLKELTVSDETIQAILTICLLYTSCLFNLLSHLILDISRISDISIQLIS